MPAPEPRIWGRPIGVKGVHNLYLRVMVENGLLGIVSLLVFLGGALATMWRGVRRGGADASMHAACFATVLGILGES